jgi:hypothetical protein
MNKQLTEIDDFLQSVGQNEMNKGQQSFVLASPLNVIGGANGSGSCNNYEAEACGGSNKRCTNYGVCGTSDNTRNCTNKPATIKPLP